MPDRALRHHSLTTPSSSSFRLKASDAQQGIKDVKPRRAALMPRDSCSPLTASENGRILPLLKGILSEVMAEVLDAEVAKESPPPEITAWIEEREVARRAQEWPRADVVCGEPARRGYIGEDSSGPPLAAEMRNSAQSNDNERGERLRNFSLSPPQQAQRALGQNRCADR